MRNILTFIVAMLLSGCFSDPGMSTTTNNTDGTEETGGSGSTDGSTSGDGTGTSTDGTDGTEETGETGFEPDMGGDTGEPELPDPALWYAWEEDFLDYTGDADGVPQGLMAFEEVDDGHAAYFGGPGHIDASAYAAKFVNNLGAWTFAVKYRQDNSTGIQQILALGSTGPVVEHNDWRLQLSSSYISIVTQTGLGDVHVADIANTPAIQEWHSLVVVLDGDTAHVYLDGDGQGSTKYVPAETTSQVLLVGLDDCCPHQFVGAMDDLQIYNEALDEEAALFLSTL